MQELLGRIARLDPSASLGLRVIACFDELIVGNVNTRGLLSAAASLAGCVAGFEQQRPRRIVRITPRGELQAGKPPVLAAEDRQVASGGLVVWLERDGAPAANDAIILERLALAVRIRHGRGRDQDNRRELGLLLDRTVPIEQRCTAAAALGLSAKGRFRVLAAPLFAVWSSHPDGPEDVVPTRHGPLHALVLPDEEVVPAAAPSGLGVPTAVEDLHHSWRTALVALCLCDPPRTTTVTADDYSGLIDLLADSPADAYQPDATGLDEITRLPWGLLTVEAVVRSQSLRQAARHAGVHHSTMQTRVDTLCAVLGFDPFDGFGRTRLGTAYLVWRLRHSHVLELPAPQTTPTSARPT